MTAAEALNVKIARTRDWFIVVIYKEELCLDGNSASKIKDLCEPVELVMPS